MKSILVIGTARSGTSITCGVLSMLGVNITSNTPKPHQLRHNPKGMFEQREFKKFSLRIAKDVQNKMNVNEVVQKYKEEVLKTTFPFTDGLWGFKCESLYGIEVLSIILENPYIIHVSRDLEENAKSFQIFRQVTDGVITPLEDIKVEIANNNQIISESINRCDAEKIQTTYHNLRKNTWGESKKIADFLKIKTTQSMKNKTLDFVDDNIHTWKESNGKLTPIDPRT